MKRQQIVAIILVLFIAATSVVSFVPAVLEVISLRSGSRGEDVRLAQERLKKWGYYKGNADGIFGKNTFNAVKSFQKKNGLLVDGIIGDKTSKAMGITLNGSPTPTKATAKATAKATPTPAKAKATTSGKSTAKSNATPYISLAPAAHKTATPKPTVKAKTTPTVTPKPTMKPTPKPTQLPTARPFTTSKPVAVSPAPKPAAATPVATKANTSNAAVEKDVYLLARLIYAEARSESSKGKMAVGGVVLNRVKHAEFPNSISGVIYQPNAFSVVKDGQINLAPDAASLKAARDCMNGLDPSGGSIFFYNPKKTKNKFLLSRKVVVTIGNHRFCK